MTSLNEQRWRPFERQLYEIVSTNWNEMNKKTKCKTKHEMALVLANVATNEENRT